MKKTPATVLLIILNALAFFAGIWAALNFGGLGRGFGTFLWLSVIYLAVVPAPLVFAWSFFRDVYGFSKLEFYLCTLLPPFIISSALNIIMVVQLQTVGSQNGGYGGLALIGLIMVNSAATLVLTISIVLWTTFCELVKSDRAKKVWAIVLLGVCGTMICSGLRGLLGLRYSGAVAYVYTDEQEFITSFILGFLRGAAIMAIPLGFGAAKLMKIYREKCSLKPLLFYLLAFAPTLLIAGGLMIARYFESPERNFFNYQFLLQIETAIFTPTVAAVSAMIYGISTLIRRKKHYY